MDQRDPVIKFCEISKKITFYLTISFPEILENTTEDDEKRLST